MIDATNTNTGSATFDDMVNIIIKLKTMHNSLFKLAERWRKIAKINRDVLLSCDDEFNNNQKCESNIYKKCVKDLEKLLKF